MDYSKSHPAFKNRFLSVLHNIVLIAMLHSTFVAPAQGLIEAYVNKSEPLRYKGYYLNDYNTAAIQNTSKLNPVGKTTVDNAIAANFKNTKAVVKNNKAEGVGVVIAKADLKEGIIGISKDKPIDNPFDNLFKVTLNQLPQGNQKVYLKYDLYGVSDHNAVARSINERLSIGGYLVKRQMGWSAQKEELDASWLKAGENKILFTIPRGAGYQYKIKNLTIEFENTDKVNEVLVVQEHNLYLSKNNRVYIKGFLRGNNAGAKVQVGDNFLEVNNNEFEGYVTLTEENKKNKFLSLRALSNNGILGQELLMLDTVLEADLSFAIQKKELTAVKQFTALTASQLIIEGAWLKVSDNTLAKNYEMSVTQLRPIDIAPMESGMVNVTKGGRGYRFLPDGARFDKPVSIAIEYDTLLLPPGYTAKDIKTYFFDTKAKRWSEIEKDGVDVKKHTIISSTTHFTDYINGIIQVPESPETSASIPTAMNDIKAADPSSEITIIQPPQASQKGDANVSYPIKIPSGRNGMQPQLAIQYSNDGGNGWLGQGWNLNTPAISIDTRWGAPIFDAANETELYSLDGDMLMFPNGYLPQRHSDVSAGVYTTSPQARNASGNKTFLPRKQGSFDKIERLGNSPSTYYWKVTGADGTISWYGADTPANLTTGNAVLKNAAGAIVHWALYMVQDVYGNNIRYVYNNVVISSSQATGVNANLLNGKIFYLKTIYYTGTGTTNGNYQIDFVTETSVIRPDVTISGRLGIKQIDPYRLKTINVRHNPTSSTPLRSYQLYYGSGTGKLGKSRLLSLTEQGIGAQDYYTHTFEYYDDITENGVDVYFDADIDLNICNDTIPCVDTDGDGVCDINDACPTVAGTLPNGCNPASQGCYAVTIEKPTIYQYTYTSPTINGYGDSCYWLPMYVSQVSFGQIGSVANFTPSNLYLTHFNGTTTTTLCPPGPVTNSTAVQYPGFTSNMESWLNATVFPGYDIYGADVQNYSVVSNTVGTAWGYANYYTLTFLSSFSDLNFSSTLNSAPGNINATLNITPENLSHTISSSGMPVPILVNGQPLAQSAYNLQSGVSSFITAFQQQYPQAQITNSGNYIYITVPNSSAPLNTISVNGDIYTFTNCSTGITAKSANSTASAPGNWFDSFGNNFSIGFNSSASGGNPDCPSFLNLDFLIQGTIPSFQSAGAVLGSTKATSYSASGYIGVGIGWSVYTNNTTFGGGYSRGWDKSESLTQMIDIDGDGLEDIVSGNGDNIYYQKHIVTVGYNASNQIQVSHAFQPKKLIHGMDKFYREEGTSNSYNFDISMGFASFGAFAGKDWSDSKAESDIFFTDGNGDGLPDIVRHDRVYFNRLDSSGVPTFEDVSENTENMVITAAPLEVVVPAEYYDSEVTYPKNDVVKVWEAPASGMIKIKNNIELTDTTKQSMVTIEMPKSIAPPCTGNFALFPTPSTSIYQYTPGVTDVYSQSDLYLANCFVVTDRFYSFIDNNNIEHDALPQDIFLIHGDNANYDVSRCPSTPLTTTPDSYVKNPYCDAKIVSFLGATLTGLNIPYYYLQSYNTGEIYLSNNHATNHSAAYFMFYSPLDLNLQFKMQYGHKNPAIGSLPPTFYLDAPRLRSINKTPLTVYLSTNVYVNNTALPNNPYNINLNFNQFKTDFQNLYPGSLVTLNSNTGTILITTSNTSISTIKIEYQNSNATHTYNFAPCGSTLKQGDDITANWDNIMPTEEDLTYAENKRLALGEGMAAPISPLHYVKSFNFTDKTNNNITGNYTIEKENESITWYNDDKSAVVEDANTIKLLNALLPTDFNAGYAALQEKNAKEEIQKRQNEKDNAIAALDVLQSQQKIVQDNFEALTINTATCAADPGDLCQVFGARLTSSNSIINNEIINYSASCSSSQQPLYVNKGDRIYFRVHSIDAGNPTVNWDPRVEYTNATLVATTDENGLALYKSNYSDGFVLSEANKETVFMGTGHAEFSWPSVTVTNPSDQVIFEIVKKVLTGPEASYGSITETPVYRKTCAAGSTTTVSAASNEIAGINMANVAITAYNSTASTPTSQSVTVFYFRVKSTSNVNWKAYEWRPKMVCVTNAQNVIGDGGAVEGNVTTQEIKYPVPDYSLYKLFSCSQEYNRYSLSTATSFTITPSLSGIFASGDTGTLNFVVKKGGQLVGKKTVVVNGTSLTITGTIAAIPITAGDKIEIGYYIDDSKLADGQASILNKIAQTANKVAIITYTTSSGTTTANIFKQNVNLFQKTFPRFGPMYRQWGQFMYAPGAVTGAQPLIGLPGNLIKESALVLDSQTANAINDAVNSLENAGYQNFNLDTNDADFEAQLDTFESNNSTLFNTALITARAQRDYINGAYDERWIGMHPESYTTALAYKAATFDQVFEGVDEGSDDITQGVLQTGAYAISKFSKGSGKNLSGGFSLGVAPVASVSVSGSKSTGGNGHMLTDYIDMNGDRYPDIVSTENIQLTQRTGGLYPHVGRNSNLNGDLTTSSSSNWGVGSSGSFYRGSKETTGSKGAKQKLPLGLLKCAFFGKGSFDMFSGSSSIGISGEFSKGDDDTSKMWLDLNGDGLADLLKKNGSGMDVKMNFGDNSYSTTQYSSWSGFDLNEGAGTSFGGGLGYSYKNSIEAGYSLGKTISNSNNTIIDMNSDGLPDLISSSDDHLSVSLNDGNGFGSSLPWASFSLHSSAQTTKSSLNIGATGAWIWPLYLVFVVIPIKAPAITGKVSRATSTNNTKKTVTDFDGDGYPDLLEETSPGHIKVKPSRIRRTDMLKSVSNPLGGKFTVNYDVSRPTYDNPNPKWVMSDVVVEDGYNVDGDGFDAYWKKYEYQGARYDRREREFYGFETVKTIDYNMDEDNEPTDVYRTSVTKYHNHSFYLNGLVKEQYVMIGSNETQLYSKTVNSYIVREINYTTGLLGSTVAESFDTGGREGRKGAEGLLAKTDTYLYEFGSNPLLTTVTLTYDNYGRVKEYIDGAATGTGDDYKAVISYQDDPALLAKNIINVPKQIDVLKVSSGTLMRRRKTVVDVNTGSIQKVSVLLNIDQSNNEIYAVTNMEYYTNGNLKKVTMPQPDTGLASMFYEYTYDGVESKYVTVIKDAFSQTTSTTYDYRFDKPLTTTDITGNSIKYTYDNFGRLSSVLAPKEAAQGIPYTIKFTYYAALYNLPQGQSCIGQGSMFMPLAITQHYDDQHPGNDVETITIMDGIGRAVQIKKDIEINTGTNQQPHYEEKMSISGIMTYDAFGRAIKQHHPWFEDKNCSYNYVFNDYETGYFSQFSYDVVDRPLKFSDPEGNISTTGYSIENDFYGVPAAKTKSITEQNSQAQIINEVFKDITGKVTSTKNILAGNVNDDIWTSFRYNCLNEMESYTDDEGITTKYEYDKAGRKTKVSHPDNGITTYYYDMASNLISLQTANLLANSSLQPADRFIKYTYDRTRLMKITYPDTPSGVNIANVTYLYGGITEGNNTGKLVYQQDATGEQFFDYGNMGELVNNKRTVVGPNIPTRTFNTSFDYDSWNRVKMIVYPDGEKVSYTYNLGGNLFGIDGMIGSDPYKYIQRIDYDYYDQRTYLLYGNNTETSYAYTPALRRLNNLNVLTSTQEAMLNNTYEYDKVGNVTSSYNDAAENSINLIGGKYNHSYKYDNLNRLVFASGGFAGNASQQNNGNDYMADYQVEMKYTSTNGISNKNQKHTKNNNIVVPNSYNNDYAYIPGTHKVLKISDSNSGLADDFDYDLNGNMTVKHTDQAIRNFFWDEGNLLRVVADEDAMQHYIYDANGERVLKATSHIESLYENGSLVNNNVNFETYTTYPSAYLVIDGDGQYSKHYYAGSQRIVSRIGDESADIFDSSIAPRLAAPQSGGVKGTPAFSEEEVRNLQIADLTLILKKAKKGVPVFKKYEPDTGGKDNADKDGATAKNSQLENINSTTAAPPSGPEQFPYNNIYFYHPDLLGTSTYLTDANGMPYQFFLNLPFGETMAEQHSLTEDYATPYKFNGKELDVESGFYYYGARYYDPKASIWLSVDPLAEDYQDFSPYNYGLQDPVGNIDPDGRGPLRVIGWAFKWAWYGVKSLVPRSWRPCSCGPNGRPTDTFYWAWKMPDFEINWPKFNLHRTKKQKCDITVNLNIKFNRNTDVLDDRFINENTTAIDGLCNLMLACPGSDVTFSGNVAGSSTATSSTDSMLNGTPATLGQLQRARARALKRILRSKGVTNKIRIRSGNFLSMSVDVKSD